jgi:malate/lactate dehydrogenase
VSVAVTSDGDHYDIPADLTFGFPIQADGQGSWKVKQGFNLDDFAKGKIKITTEELLGERDDVTKFGLI